MGTFGEVRNAGNPHRSQRLIFDPAGFPRVGGKAAALLLAARVSGCASSTSVSWRRFNETNRQIRPAGTLGIPFSSASALFTFNTPPICLDRPSSFQGRRRAGLKLIKRPRLSGGDADGGAGTYFNVES